MPLAGAYALAAVLIAPFLYYLFAGGVQGPYYSGLAVFDADLANLARPRSRHAGTYGPTGAGSFVFGVAR